MRISAKARYGLAAMAHLAQSYDAAVPVTIISIAEKLGISKIYLEQVFSLLKRAALVVSIKGAQGGYQLAAPPTEITIYAILAATELSFAEETDKTVAKTAPALEVALQSCVFGRIDQTLRETCSQIKLADLTAETERHLKKDAYMYFI